MENKEQELVLFLREQAKRLRHMAETRPANSETLLDMAREIDAYAHDTEFLGKRPIANDQGRGRG